MFRHFSTGVIALALLVAGSAGATASADESPRGVSLAFELPATNGYTATVIAGFNPELGRGGAIVSLHDKDSSVAYETSSAQVTGSSIQASLGALGEIDVHLVSGEGTTTERSECGGKPLTFPAARWEGTIHIRGEEGFAEVDASSAENVIGPFLDIVCADERTERTGGHSPGALLELERRHGTERLSLSVRKNKRVGPTRIGVEQSERRGKVEIMRSVSVVEPSAAFDFEIPPGLAAVQPSKPFSGLLSLTRRPGFSPSVKGNLKVDLPGRPAVPILGSGTIRASLVRAVLNPSHPS